MKSVAINFSDKDLFGNDAGEDEELEVLSAYFVENDDFNNFIDENERLSIISARKGMGKSALLSKLFYDLTTGKYGDVNVIRVKGGDLLGLGDFENRDVLYLENYWRQIICKRIILELGSKANVAISDNAMTMVEMAELEGFKGRNILRALLSRVKLKVAGVEVDRAGAIPNSMPAMLESYWNEKEDKPLWLLVDDIDAKFQNSQDQRNRVGAFFSAIRSISFDYKNIRVRATVRSDVWASLKNIEDMDKLDQYTNEIFWTKKHMAYILASKIASYIKRRNIEHPIQRMKPTKDYNRIIDCVFESPIKWGDKDDARMFEAINSLSSRRPRWMGQLCRMAALEAKKSTGQKRIKLEHINRAEEKYGRKRRDDLIKEHAHQFCEIKALIDCFRTASKTLTRNEISDLIENKYIRGRHRESIPKIDGLDYINPDDLGNFVFKLGLISRLHDDRSIFTHYVDDPDLYSSGENKDNNIVWSIHPAYRKFLNLH